ncbi:MAG: cyclodeaminase/cyclohydrolase family protein [Ktedonobacteraceae bacterium]
MYGDQSLQHYLTDLAASIPMPAGGSAAALSGAMGAALVSMVAGLTLGKVGYAQVQQEIEALLQRSEQLRARFQDLMQEDIEAYKKFSACYKLPCDTDEERAARRKAMQAQLVEVTLVPLQMVEIAATLMELCKRVAQIGNVRILSDLAVGATLATSAGTSAAVIVRANVQMMKDSEHIHSLNDRLSRALESIAERSMQIHAIIEEREHDARILKR